jgi:predicted Rossmann fold nucleotide-binding protein DprA/Smf involved in DNA uptake
VGLSAQATATVVGRVRSAVAGGSTEAAVLADQLDLDQGLVTAALLRLQEAGELIADPTTRTFSLKESP